MMTFDVLCPRPVPNPICTREGLRDTPIVDPLASDGSRPPSNHPSPNPHLLASPRAVSHVGVSRAFKQVREWIAGWVARHPIRLPADDLVEVDEILIAALRGHETTRTGQCTRKSGWIL